MKTKIRIMYAYRESSDKPFKDQSPRIITGDEFEQMCRDYQHYLILRTGIVSDE